MADLTGCHGAWCRGRPILRTERAQRDGRSRSTGGFEHSKQGRSQGQTSLGPVHRDDRSQSHHLRRAALLDVLHNRHYVRPGYRSICAVKCVPELGGWCWFFGDSECDSGDEGGRAIDARGHIPHGEVADERSYPDNQKNPSQPPPTTRLQEHITDADQSYRGQQRVHQSSRGQRSKPQHPLESRLSATERFRRRPGHRPQPRHLPLFLLPSHGQAPKDHQRPVTLPP